MKTEVRGSPAFAHIYVELQPGETVIAEADAMTSMSAEMDMDAKFNGGFISGLMKKFLGGESLFVNHFTNKTQKPLTVTLVQPTPGDIREVNISGSQVVNLQPGAYIASDPGIKLGLKYAGFKSFIAREGLFKLQLSGNGRAWFGCYGGLLEKEVDGEYIVDTSHLVSYPEGMQMKLQLAGGLFSSFFGGEGIVTRLEGKGKITIQTRSMESLVDWINPQI